MRTHHSLVSPSDGGGPSVCPHCWMVNPSRFRLCARCGASMETHLQESAGLRRVAPIQSPVPVGQPMGPVARVILGTFVVLMALGYVAHLMPLAGSGPAPRPGSPATQTP